MLDPATVERKPSTWYLLTFSAGGIAIGALGLATEARYGGGVGAGSKGAFSHATELGLIFALSLAYVVRLIFWSRVPLRIQKLVRNVLTCVFILSVTLSVIFLVMCFSGSGPGVPIEFHIFAIAAAVLQIPAVIWLIRYRQE